MLHVAWKKDGDVCPHGDRRERQGGRDVPDPDRVGDDHRPRDRRRAGRAARVLGRDPDARSRPRPTRTSTPRSRPTAAPPGNCTTGSIVPLGAQAYGSDASATTLPDGTTLQACSGTLGTWVHAGLDPATPNFNFQTAGNYGYDPGIAVGGQRDGDDGVVLERDRSGPACSRRASPPTARRRARRCGCPARRCSKAARRSPARRSSRGPTTAGSSSPTGSAPDRRSGARVARRLDQGAAARPTENNTKMALAADATGRLWAVWTDGDVRLPARAGRALEHAGASVFGQPVDLGAAKDANSTYAVDAYATATSLDVLAHFGIGDDLVDLDVRHPRAARADAEGQEVRPRCDVHRDRRRRRR